MKIETTDLLQFRHFRKIIIIRKQLRIQIARQPHELRIHFTLLRKIAIVDLHLIARITLNAIQHFGPAAAARAFDRVVRIGDLLKFAQDENAAANVE